MAKAIPGGLYTGDTVTYQYDNDGALAKTVDSETGVETAWYYDTTGRLTKHTEKGSGREYSISYEYDDKNNVTKTVEKANGNTVTQTYDYDMDNRPTAVHVTKVVGMDTQIHHILYFYDTLGRLQEQRIVNDDSYHGPIGTNWGAVQYAYTYVGAEGSTAPQISNVVMSGPNMQEQFTYTYDSTGNIATAYEGLSPYSGTVTYGYDALNEVVSEQNGTAGIDWTYYYDNSGNITHVIGRDIDDFRTQVESNTYTYGNSEWGDLLTAYNGTAITYDQIGNRLTDGTWTYTWEHGRELASMSNGTTTWSYTYDANGLRTRRTNGTATYDYIYDGSGKLVCMDCGSYELYFTYDPVSGAPLTVTYTDSVDSTTYYYITNFRGDVCGIATDYGGVIAMYEYNAWGELVYMDDYTALGIASINPLRYRGYVYDRETGLYYLQSRYYDPEIGRFINADAFAATGQGLTGNNMFAYCGNNPVGMVDSGGYFFFTALGAATGFISGAITAMLSGQDKETWFETACHSAIGGAIAGAGVDTALLILGTAGTATPVVVGAFAVAYTLGGLGNVYTTYATSNGNASGDDLLGSFIIGGTFNTLSLATGLSATSNTVDGLFVKGMADMGDNIAVGVGIGVSTSIATSIGTLDSPFAVKRDFKRRAVL